MRESHHDVQTTKKEPTPVSSNHKAKSTNTPSKKPNHQQQKSIKKKLSFAFTPITEDDDVLNLPEKKSIHNISSMSESVDVNQSTTEISKSTSISDQDLVSENAVVLHHPEQSIGISSASEAFVSNKDQFTESKESYIMSPKQLISLSSTTTGLVEFTPSSSAAAASLITTADAEAFFDSVIHDGATTEDMNSLNIQSMMNDLRESMCQVLNSADLEPKYKKLFDALIKMVLIEELHSLHEEKDTMIVLLSFVLASIVAGSVGFFLFSDAQSSYYSPPPT